MSVAVIPDTAARGDRQFEVLLRDNEVTGHIDRSVIAGHIFIGSVLDDNVRDGDAAGHGASHTGTTLNGHRGKRISRTQISRIIRVVRGCTSRIVDGVSGVRARHVVGRDGDGSGRDGVAVVHRIEVVVGGREVVQINRSDIAGTYRRRRGGCSGQYRRAGELACRTQRILYLAMLESAHGIGERLQGVTVNARLRIRRYSEGRLVDDKGVVLGGDVVVGCGG